MEKNSGSQRVDQFSQNKSGRKTLLFVGIGCISLIIMLCLCYLLAMLVSGNLSWMTNQIAVPKGQSNSTSIIAVAINLDGAKPAIYQFVGNINEDPWILPPGNYYIEAAGTQDLVYSFGRVTINEQQGKVDLSELIESTGGIEHPIRKQELILIANTLVSIGRGKLTYLSLFSDDFTVPLFSINEDMSAGKLKILRETYNGILDKQEEATNALLELEMRSGYGTGGINCRGVCSSKNGILESLVTFFWEIKKVDQRAVEDILKGSAAMSAGEKADAFEYFTPSMTGNSQSFDEMIQKLQAGELTDQANRIRNFLCDEESFYNALQQNRGTNRPILQIAHEEGAVLIEKGAELEVEIIKGALEAQFPGIEKGDEYANQINEWVEFIQQTYNDPTASAFDYASGLMTEKVSDQIKEGLQEMGIDEEQAEEMAEYLSEEIASQLTKHDDEVEELAGDEEAEKTKTVDESSNGDSTREPDETSTPTNEKVASPSESTRESSETKTPNEVLLSGGLSINVKDIYGFCTVKNDCALITNEVRLNIHPGGGSAIGDGTLAADVFQPPDVEIKVVRITHDLTFTGNCSESGYCSGSGIGDVTFPGFAGSSYDFTWEGQYGSGVFDGMIHSENGDMEMLLMIW